LADFREQKLWLFYVLVTKTTCDVTEKPQPMLRCGKRFRRRK